jgi:hypothetical protein
MALIKTFSYCKEGAGPFAPPLPKARPGRRRHIVPIAPDMLPQTKGLTSGLRTKSIRLQ